MSFVSSYHTSLTHQQSRRGGVLGFVSTLMDRLRNRREMNRLLSMPDYQLRDIGLQRGDIQREALRPLWRQD